MAVLYLHMKDEDRRALVHGFLVVGRTTMATVHRDMVADRLHLDKTVATRVIIAAHTIETCHRTTSLIVHHTITQEALQSRMMMATPAGLQSSMAYPHDLQPQNMILTIMGDRIHHLTEMTAVALRHRDTEYLRGLKMDLSWTVDAHLTTAIRMCHLIRVQILSNDRPH
jgi:hypothetical protein